MRFFLLLLLTLLFACQNNKSIPSQVDKKAPIINDTIDTNRKIPDLSTQNEYKKKILEYMERIRYSEYLEPDGGSIMVEKNGGGMEIEISSEMNTGEEFWYYHTVKHEDGFREYLNHTFFVDSQQTVLLVIEEDYRYSMTTYEDQDRKMDTLYYKDDLLYFGGYNHTTVKELRRKEKELDIIINEIISLN